MSDGRGFCPIANKVGLETSRIGGQCPVDMFGKVSSNEWIKVPDKTGEKGDTTVSDTATVRGKTRSGFQGG